MRILYNGQDFELPTGFSASIVRSNIIISAFGEQTAPITLPPSPHNLNLLKWGDRIDGVYKPLNEIPIFIIDKGINKSGILSLNSPPNEEDGINCTIYFSESEFYSVIEDKKVNSLPWPEVKNPDYGTQTLEENVQYLIDLLKSEYESPFFYAGEWRIAPLATDKEYTEIVNTVEKKGLIILNGFDATDLLTLSLTDPPLIHKFRGETDRVFVENDVEIPTTKGYGMTVFMKVRYVMEFIFEQFGYAFDFSDLDATIQIFEEHYFENNIIDAIYAGVLKYKQLIPDLTIKQFIVEFEKLYAGKFFFNPVTKVVKFYCYKVLFPVTPDADLTGYLASKLVIKSTNFEKIIIKSSTQADEGEESTEKVTTIEFDLHPYVTVSEDYYIFTNQPIVKPIALNMVQCTGIIHQNSVLTIGGKVTKENAETNKRFDIVTIWDELESFDIILNGNTFHINYKTTKEIDLDPSAYSASAIQKIREFYEEYIQFKLNSNILLSCKMNMPDLYLQKLNINTPKIIQGQKVLIESIENGIGDTREKIKTQNVTLRTLRSYQDRP